MMTQKPSMKTAINPFSAIGKYCFLWLVCLAPLVLPVLCNADETNYVARLVMKSDDQKIHSVDAWFTVYKTPTLGVVRLNLGTTTNVYNEVRIEIHSRQGRLIPSKYLNSCVVSWASVDYQVSPDIDSEIASVDFTWKGETKTFKLSPAMESTD